MQGVVQYNLPTCNKCNQVGHKARQCPQNGPPAPVVFTNGGPCGVCKKPNHSTENCKFNPQRKPENNGGAKGNNNGSNNSNNNNGKQNEQKKPQLQYDGYVPKYWIEPYKGEKLWCAICNSNDHDGSFCAESASPLRLSKMVCRNCGARGHTESECKHPDPIHCTTCHKPGHKSDGCRDPAAAFYKVQNLLQDKDRRFVWTAQGENTIQPGPGQVEEYLAEQQIKRIQEALDLDMDIDVDQMDLSAAWQEVSDSRTIVWPHNELVHRIPLRLPVNVPASKDSRHFRVNKSQKSSGSSNTSIIGTLNDHNREWLRKLTKVPAPVNTRSWSSASQASQPTHQAASAFIPNNNPIPDPNAITPATVLAAVERINEERLSNVQRAVRAKIDASLRLYHKQNYNRAIQALSLQIVERGAISQPTLLQVQYAMAMGWQFWRDPTAMDGLARGKSPVCHTCGNHGAVVDGHMLVLDTNSVRTEGYKAFFQVEEFKDWGVFVVFGCQCCNRGYSWLTQQPVLVEGEQERSVPNSARLFQQQVLPSER